MNLYHIKLTDHQKAALEHLFSLDIAWNKTELEKAWNELREQVRDSAQCVAIINALQNSGCNCKKPAEPAPQHDPCRKFRAGDKVRLIEWNGRRPFDTHHGLPLNPGEVHIVLDDEYERNEVYIGMSAADEEQSVIHACNLELITPIEELEPYEIAENIYGWIVFKDTPGNVVANFNKNHPHAKEAAEAECARLNAEHRKEQKNDCK